MRGQTMTFNLGGDPHRIDGPVELAALERREGEPIRVRLQPSVFRRGLGQYRYWAGVSWTVDCRSVEEAVGLREALQAFFTALERGGVRAVVAALDSVARPATVAS